MKARQLAPLLAVLLVIACDKNAGIARRHGDMTVANDERRFTVDLSLQTRGGALFVPKSLPKSGAGLVIALHGMNSSGEAFRSRGFDAYAIKHGFIVAYPDGLNGGWSSHDDNAFFGHIIEGMKRNYKIDERKVFMTGHSLGAIQCYESAVALGGALRAIAPVSSPMSADSAQLTVSLGPQHPGQEAKPTRVLIIHSLDDEVIPYDGKFIGNIYSIRQTLDFWKRVNGCTNPPVEFPCGPGFDGRLWRGDRADCVVVTRFQGGHSWPPTATGMIVGFFLES